MPNITVYMNDEEWIKFRGLSMTTQTALKKKFIKSVMNVKEEEE